MDSAIRLTVNGHAYATDVAVHHTLLDFLRDQLALTGTKECCAEGECGACTVLIDGAPVCSCLVPFAQAERTAVVTIEGLGDAHPLQRCFMDEVGAQCGICTPGMIMAASVLAPDASLDDIRVGLAGNLCRCTGYSAIYRAVMAARSQAASPVAR